MLHIDSLIRQLDREHILFDILLRHKFYFPLQVYFDVVIIMKLKVGYLLRIVADEFLIGTLPMSMLHYYPNVGLKYTSALDF